VLVIKMTIKMTINSWRGKFENAGRELEIVVPKVPEGAADGYGVVYRRLVDAVHI
jgi:hypothetical protein